MAFATENADLGPWDRSDQRAYLYNFNVCTIVCDISAEKVLEEERSASHEKEYKVNGFRDDPIFL